MRYENQVYRSKERNSRFGMVNADRDEIEDMTAIHVSGRKRCDYFLNDKRLDRMYPDPAFYYKKPLNYFCLRIICDISNGNLYRRFLIILSKQTTLDLCPESRQLFSRTQLAYLSHPHN